MNSGVDTELFECSGALPAKLKPALPTVFGQMSLVIYIMADTFFIGLTGKNSIVYTIKASEQTYYRKI